MASAKESKSGSKGRSRQHTPTNTEAMSDTTAPSSSELEEIETSASENSAASNNGPPSLPASNEVEAASGQPPKGREAEIREKVKELIRLAQEQGYLTYGDITEALPDSLINP